MKKPINTTTTVGLLYQHDLKARVTKPDSKNPNVPYISGKIDIATNPELTNIISIEFPYCSPTTGTGSVNKNYSVLKDILDGKLKSVMSSGAEEAAKLSITGNLSLNEFPSRDTGEVISQKINQGSFINVLSSLTSDDFKSNFDVDMIITKTTLKEADPEKGTPEKLVLKGAIFNYRKELLPYEFSVIEPRAISYFEGQGISNSTPLYTKLKGEQVSTTVEKTVVEEGVWGNSVRTYTNTRKDMIITWAATSPYLWDDESSITAAELKEAMAAREVKLAEIKNRSNSASTTASNGEVYKF